MTDREKLIALMEEAYFCSIEQLADHLIANGVVVREKGEWERKKVAFHVGCPSCGCYVRDNSEQVFLDDGTLNFCPHCGSDMRKG